MTTFHLPKGFEAAYLQDKYHPDRTPAWPLPSGDKVHPPMRPTTLTPTECWPFPTNDTPLPLNLVPKTASFDFEAGEWKDYGNTYYDIADKAYHARVIDVPPENKKTKVLVEIL